MPPGFERAPYECRLQFHRPLRGVHVVPPEMLPATPSAKPPLAAPRDDRPAPAPPKSVSPPVPPPAVPPAPPTDFWQTDAGRELKADRERIESLLGRIGSAVAELQQDRKNRLQEWQRAAVELALTIATRLLHEAHVVTVPGEAFGTGEHIRISYPVTRESIDEGTRRMAEFLKQLA